MNILYIAFSCQPNKGSEEKIGWNIPLESSKTNKVFVVTREEQRTKIEEYVKEHKPENINFYYVDINPFYKRLFKGPMLSLKLNILHKKAYPLVKEICKKERIDIIHQITPIEFRSIGAYYKIPNTRFVCGPLGGGEYIPTGLNYYGRKHMIEEFIRRLSNGLSLIFLKMKGVLKRCDAVMYANDETKRYLASVPCGGAVQDCQTEIGIDANEITQKREPMRSAEKCVFLVAGRLVYRKGHDLLLDALSGLPQNADYECHIVGNGKELARLKEKCVKLGLDQRVFFKGRVPFDEMTKIYERSHVLVLPSIRETTGSVLLEAMAKGLPIVTINRFGGAVLLDETTGWLYDGSSRKEYVENLSAVLLKCIESPDEIYLKAQNARKVVQLHTWKNKVEKYNAIYKQLLGE